jgi:lycopene cyclase CruP
MRTIAVGVFPTYRASPLQSDFDRILQVGDASGIQSPLSFGGFGSLTRHIERITTAVDEALKDDLIAAEYLNLINAYQPNLSAAWMFQRSMSVPITRNPSPTLIVSILANSFSAMNKLGDKIIRPFLQDVIQVGPLFQTLVSSAMIDFFTPLRIIPHVGLVAIGDFVYHMVMMAWFTWRYQQLASSSKAVDSIDPAEKYRRNRLLDQLKFGSGLDYEDHV